MTTNCIQHCVLVIITQEIKLSIMVICAIYTIAIPTYYAHGMVKMSSLPLMVASIEMQNYISSTHHSKSTVMTRKQPLFALQIFN